VKKRLSHVGIAVRSLAESVPVFSKLFGPPTGPAEEVADQRVRVAFFHAGPTGIELTEPTAGDSPIAKFLANRGEGVHHLSFEVDDLEAELARLKADGVRLVDETPRIGAGGCRIAFLHPRSTGGVLIELSEKQEHR
jgi:methylmalonyl-CoA/ethylmalonyl-CoA epimerase